MVFSLFLRLAFLILLGFASLLVWKLVEEFTPPVVYDIFAEFRELPSTDDELQEWLENQPNFYICSVHRDGNTLNIVIFHVTKSYSQPVDPCVLDEFERFGYLGLVSYREEKSRRDK